MSPIVQVRPGRQWQQARIAPSALALMESARHGLAAAEDEVTPGARYVSAHLAALRAAAAVVAARAEPPGGRRRRPQSVWELLPKVEPALREWAAFFAAGAAKRAAAEAGLAARASARARPMSCCGTPGPSCRWRRAPSAFRASSSCCRCRRRGRRPTAGGRGRGTRPRAASQADERPGGPWWPARSLRLVLLAELPAARHSLSTAPGRSPGCELVRRCRSPRVRRSRGFPS